MRALGVKFAEGVSSCQEMMIFFSINKDKGADLQNINESLRSEINWIHSKYGPFSHKA